MRAFLCAVCAVLVLPCAGCLLHTVRIDGAGADQAAGRSATGLHVQDGAPALQKSGPLPYEIAASWMLREGDHLSIGHTVALSPLPWWQRFPCDLAVDLWPGEVIVATIATVTPRPLTPRSAADITAEARAHGYAK
jgi:hypothetical protein